MKVAVFLAPNVSRRELFLRDFYYQDLQVLRRLGFKVVFANTLFQVPIKYDLLFVWWWSYALIPVMFSLLLFRPSIIIGTMNITESSSCFGDFCPFFRVKFLRRSIMKALLIYFSARLASVNIFVNRNEENLARKFLGLPNTIFIPHSVSLPKLSHSGYSSPTRLQFLLSYPFLLNISWSGRKNLHRKNIYSLIEAFDSCCSRLGETRLLIGGLMGDGCDDLKRVISESSNSSRIHYIGEVSAKEKIFLMEKCLAFVQPSFYEGFGCAVGEAMLSGAPVIASSAGGLRDLCGDACIRVDPYDLASISSAMIEIFQNPTLRSELAGFGRKRMLENFSIESKTYAFKNLIGSISPALFAD